MQRFIVFGVCNPVTGSRLLTGYYADKTGSMNAFIIGAWYFF
jgi:hypothetical protein